MQRAELLKAAEKAVMDRGLNYSKPEDNFERIARLWNAHLHNRNLLKHSYGLLPEDVALLLGLVKVGRLSNDFSHRDSWIDLAGYAACGGEIATANENVVVPKSAYEISESVNFHKPRFDAVLEKLIEPMPDSLVRRTASSA